MGVVSSIASVADTLQPQTLTFVASMGGALIDRMTAFDRLLQNTSFRCGVLALLTLLVRIMGASGPYFADDLRHISAIESGKLVIHAPGYFLFNASGFVISYLFHVSAANALQILNITFSISGAVVFYLLLTRLTAIRSPFLLSLAYTCSPIVWFSGDVHCSYASVTFFAPLLILVVEGERRFVWGCVIWALMAGFRPSDGVFVLPWMVYHSVQFRWKDRLIGVAVAVPISAAWWIPSVERYGHGLLSPFRGSGAEANKLAQGLLAGGFGLHAFVNAFHAVAGIIMTWGVLVPVLCLGATAWMRNRTARSMTIFLLPGLAFFLLYYVSDSPYFAYLAAAGMILAGTYMEEWSAKWRHSIYAVAISTSVLFMLCARPAYKKTSTARAVADAYFLKYSIPSIKEHKDPRLASLLGACDDSEVRGICK